ncbi:hypothetical protein D3C73_1106410 [compost metagenome]
MLGVVDDVALGRQGVARVLELDQPGFVQQHQGTASVHWVVGDRHAGAILELGDVLDPGRIGAKGLDVYTDHGHQVSMPGLVVVIEEWPVLVVVGVEVLQCQLLVGLDEVGEHLDVQVHAFLGQGRFDELEDLGMGHRGGTDGEFFVGVNAKRHKGSQNGQGLFHVALLGR